MPFRPTLALGCLLAGSVMPLLAHANDAPLSAAVKRALAEQGQAEVLLQLAPARLDALPAGVGPAGFAERNAAVVARLRAHAAHSQAPVLALLDDLGLPAQSLWISNSIATRLDSGQAKRLTGLPGVQRISLDAASEGGLPKAVATAKQTLDSIEPHLAAMQVLPLWNRGVRGAGVVIGAQDTGYEWSHPALRQRYLGWNGQTADHAYHWWDAVRSAVHPGGNRCGYASPQPCDDTGHGTHTLGTVLGDGGPFNRIGAAPDADWIACRNMDRGIGRPSTYLGCFQFFLAPTNLAGAAPQPARAPHITVNSWGCPTGAPPAGEDCAQDSFEAALAAAEAAGQLTVVAAGNGNASCGSISAPPSTSSRALVVGATDNAGQIAAFSLWGPITVDGSGRLKPDLSAPGVQVRSSVPGGSYGTASGTSMATPGVSGVAALLLSANPLLIGQPRVTADLLRATAQPALHIAVCAGFNGQQSPNPIFGHGRIDAEAAFAAATQEVVTAAHSGAWYDPARSGEGWILHVLENGTASLVWYSFAPASEGGGPDWLLASDGRIVGEQIHFDRVQQVRGGRFGSAFDSAAIAVQDWGRLSLRFDGCAAAELDYQGPAAFGQGQRQLQRLSQHRGLRCGEPVAAAADRGSSRSGAWFDPARSGEGWLIDELDDGLATLTWFTFDPSGRPTWLYGLGQLDAGRLQIDSLQQVAGGAFGADFDPASLRESRWGSLEIDFSACEQGRLRYRADDPAWGEGERPLQRLTRVFGLEGC